MVMMDLEVTLEIGVHEVIKVLKVLKVIKVKRVILV
jgi:hypothetical protein